jgi:hypothetical protein
VSLEGVYLEALWAHFYSSQVRIPSALPADADGINLRANWLKKVLANKLSFQPTDLLLIYRVHVTRTNFLCDCYGAVSIWMV